MGYVNVRLLGSASKQGHLFNDLRSLDLDVAANSETRISIFEDYEFSSSSALAGTSGGVPVLL